jgi:diguanylate cyclase (GGDEF)-like protein/PAS domain S-box-containing protein
VTWGKHRGTALDTQRVLAGYAVVMALLITARYVLPGAAWTSLVIELISLAAIMLGIWLNRPLKKLPWLLLAAASVSVAVSQLILSLSTYPPGQPVAFPSLADAFYLLSYPLVIAGLSLFVKYRMAVGDRRTAITDALILITMIILLTWFLLVHPTDEIADQTWLAKATAAAYPAADLLILAALARLLAPGTVRALSVQLITVGIVGGVLSDVIYDVMHVYGVYHRGTFADLGWLVAAAAWGAAALHPSMRELTERTPVHEQDSSLLRLIALMVVSLIAPVFQFVNAMLTGDTTDGQLAVVTAALFLLVLSRLWVLASSHRRSLGRERSLRIAGEALAAAGTVDEVVAAVRTAAATLMPASRGAVLLSVRDGNWLRPIEPGQPVQPGDPVELWLTLAGGTAAKWLSMPDIRSARRKAVQTGAAPGMPKTLPGLGRFDGAMVYPLALKDRPSGDPFIGMMLVYGQRRVIEDLSGALAILAGQATLAVERVTLTQEVIRQRGEALFRTLVHDASDVIVILADDGRIRYATPSAGGIFGEDTPIEGARLTDLVAPSARDDIARELDRMCGGAFPVGDESIWRIKRRDGRSATLEVRLSDLRSDQTVRGMVLTLRDVTEQRQLQDELKHRAFHDALTGLPNRVLFADRLDRAVSRSRIDGRTAGVLFVDLDDFKVVNDTMGHAVGDELLVAVAGRLASTVRATDTAARLGGDEFALLIEDAVDAEAVQVFAERIVAEFEVPFTLTDATVISTVTVGVATTEDSADVDELLRHADLALYAAKSAGKRRWRRYLPILSHGMIRRREVQAALEEAVRDSSFSLAYQPIVGLASGEIAGFEALVRWPHPRWGMLMPGQFIELAEETGLIVPLGAWVLRQAITDVVQWRRRLAAPVPQARTSEDPRPADGLLRPRGAELPAGTEQTDPGPYISVNVSARQFRDPGYLDSVRAALDESGLPPSALVLELTESALLGKDERVRSEMSELKELGVRLAIDDFGTGYSSLSYLLELPMNVLKIDKTFVTGINSSHRRLALVEGIVRIARTLSLEVTAEGIETETQRELLAHMGCQYGQGYLLSVPVPAGEAESLLRFGRRLVPELPQQLRKYPEVRYLRS